MKLTLPLPPPLNDMYRPNYHSKGVRKTPKCEMWEMQVQWIAKAAHCKPIPKPARVKMAVDIYYKKERDIDSSSKALNDCLQGYCYDDDRQIDFLWIRKHKDNANPRIELEVTENDI